MKRSQYNLNVEYTGWSKKSYGALKILEMSCYKLVKKFKKRKKKKKSFLNLLQ